MKKTLRRQEPPHEEERGESDSNWLVSYADMMTLLMAFFAIMFSFSTVNQEAFDQVRSAVAKQFGGKVEMPFEDLAKNLEAIIEKRKLGGEIKVQQTGSSISVVFQGSALFEIGNIDLNAQYKDTISDLLDVLHQQAVQYPVTVEGHTDDTPIQTKEFPSNWELSSSRANLILRMLETKGFPHQNMQSQGFADTRPIAPNRDAQGKPLPQNQVQNRRIAIRVEKDK